MKQTTLIVLASMAMFAVLPLATFAATYEYVNTTGSVQSEVANNPTQALSAPANIAPTSGVILVSTDDSTNVVAYGNNTYEYVNTSGNLQTVLANNATQALSAPTNMALTSGVVLLSINQQ